MFKSIKIFSFLISAILLISSCKKDELDIAALTDFPPGMLSISPSDGGKVVAGNFNVKVEFVDGTTSPLASGKVTLVDASGVELATASENLSGILDSIIIEGTTFNAADLAIGVYGLNISVTDAKGQTATKETTFEISLLPFPANHDEMYIAGAFNGWGADPMTLVADHTWEIKEIDLQGEAWKFKNTPDWTDEDWGDTDCDGVMESNFNGNGDTACGYSGLVNVQFNDQTLTYTVRPAVEFETNLSGLYLLGSFNNFEGSDNKFTLVANNTWELAEVELTMGDLFKFSEGPFFMGSNFGDSDADGIAEEFGNNIVFGEQSAFYKMTFNDKTLAYSYEFVRFPSIGIIGSATPGGWDTDTEMDDNGDGTFGVAITLVDGVVKFRANGSWTTNWGGTDFPTGVGTQDGPDIPVVAGDYIVTFNPATGEYNFEIDAGITSVGIIGPATPGGWDEETPMISNGDGTYYLIIGLTDGEAKFRANGNWDLSWGGNDFPSGIATSDNGPDIPVTYGLYVVNFNTNTGAYSFEPAIISIIGSATPGGWDVDTDMTPDASTPSVVKGTFDLTDGEAKFRLDHDWVISWGGSDFPNGTATSDNGPNIPVTAGTYDVSFNVVTGEYSFD
ncbi:MAG: hypothetical protein DHS20C18_26600 [Saprospiraceae bacterium]|nr:MAG: hypothetical protein DHS20C18_26600 [Saprospiraceae bacterium]